MLVSNHPQLAGGSHLPDITVITPVWEGGRVVFFVASRGHHAGGPRLAFAVVACVMWLGAGWRGCRGAWQLATSRDWHWVGSALPGAAHPCWQVRPRLPNCNGTPTCCFLLSTPDPTADIGGISPGSMPPHSHSLREEGAAIISHKLVQVGVHHSGLWVGLGGLAGMTGGQMHLHGPCVWSRMHHLQLP